MSWPAIVDSIRVAEVKQTSDDLALYRKKVCVAQDSSGTPVYLNLIDIAPEKPEQTLVLVHGFAATHAWWRRQIIALAQHNRVIAPDLRGHGCSSYPPNGYSVAQMVADLAAALDALGVNQPVILGGHSSGGFIAADFALRYPERVSKLVLVATPVRLDPRRLPLQARVAMSLPDFVYRLVQPFIKHDPKGRGNIYLAGLKRLYDDLVCWNGEDQFSKLTQPALVILGDRDFIFQEADYSRVAELIPQSERVNIGVSKHQVPLERPLALVRAIQRFIAPQAPDRFEPGWRSENDAIDTIDLLRERPWVARYEGNVPRMLDIPKISLNRLLEFAAERYPRRPAMSYRGVTLSYQDLDREANHLAGVLHSLEIQKGTRVMLLLPNLPQLVVAFYGCLRLGAVAVMGNELESIDETIRQARYSGARLLVTSEAFYDRARAIRAQSEIRHVIYTGEEDYPAWVSWGREHKSNRSKQPGELHLPEHWDAELDHGWRQALSLPLADQNSPVPSSYAVEAGDAALISYTPGTTTPPKAILLTHRNLVANALQAGAWLSGIRSQPKILCAVPFSHLYGITLGMNLALQLGGTLQLGAVSDPLQLMQQIRKHKPTLLLATPSQYAALIDYPEAVTTLKGAVQWCISGVAPLPVEEKEAFERLTKARIIEGYGLSEACQLTHLNPLNHPRTGSIGLPLPATEARIVDLATGQRLPNDQIGELIVRGPQVMQGYWQDEVSTRAVLDQDGWLATGDVASMDDDGYFVILGRRHELWMNDQMRPVFPRDVEEVINELPEVSEVAVVAVANKPTAFIRLHPGEQLSVEAVFEFCRKRLPPGYAPRQVFFVDEMPRDYLGKILKDELANRYG